MFFRKKKTTVDCTVQVLFEIMEEDQRSGLCTDIRFTANGRKHHFGAWGDGGKTRKNVVFFLDNSEFSTLEELKQHAVLDGIPLAEVRAPVTVTECNGCYPDSTPQLRAIMEGSGDEKGGRR